LPTITREAYLDVALRVDRNGTAPRSESFVELGRELGLSAELTERLLSDYKAGFPTTCQLFAGVHELLASLRAQGLALGLITNGSVSMQTQKLEAVSLYERLDTVLISEKEGIRKPDAAIFRLAAARLGAEPARCVFVGDNPNADVRGAKSCGMRAVWVRDDWWNDVPLEADATIEAVTELVPILSAWRTTRR
jgi:putative hydrolase of the HAD superfamily